MYQNSGTIAGKFFGAWHRELTTRAMAARFFEQIVAQRELNGPSLLDNNALDANMVLLNRSFLS
jgi:hypothetical protein